MPRYIVTAAYADTNDGPQVYEPGEIPADTPEEAEEVARRTCVEDNGGTWPEDGEPGGIFALTDIGIRELPTAREALREALRVAMAGGEDEDPMSAQEIADMVAEVERFNL